MNIKVGKFNLNIEKKYLLVILLLLIIIVSLLIYNSQKTVTLNCSVEREKYTSSVTENYEATFKNNKLIKLIVKYKIVPDEEYYTTIDNLYQTYEESLSKLKLAGGYDYTLTKTDSDVEYTVTIDMKKIPLTTEMAIGYDEDWKLNDFKKNLEKYDFKCK